MFFEFIVTPAVGALSLVLFSFGSLGESEGRSASGIRRFGLGMPGALSS
jgi:hypothetical protein